MRLGKFSATILCFICVSFAYGQDYLSSEAEFSRHWGDQVEKVAPGVYILLQGDASKTFAFGENGMRYVMGLMQSRLNESGNLERNDESTGRQLAAISLLQSELLARSTENDQSLDMQNPSRSQQGTVCGAINYDLEVEAWNASYWDAQASSSANYTAQGVGPPNLFSGGYLYTEASAIAIRQDLHESDFAGPFPTNGLNTYSAETSSVITTTGLTSPNTCRSSDALAWVLIDGCIDGFRSASDSFEYACD